MQTAQAKTIDLLSIGMLTLVGFVLSAIMPYQVQAQIYFIADFDDLGFPSPEVNDVNEWNNNVVTPGKALWAIQKTKQSGNALSNGTNGCESTTATLLPDPKGTLKNLTDYTIVADFTYRDNDHWGLAVRHDGNDKFYAMAVGASDDARVLLCAGPTQDGACYACPKGPISKPSGVIIDETGNTVYTFRFTVQGDQLKAEFGVKGPGNPDEPDAIDPKTLVVVESGNGKFEKGSPAILNFTINGTVDNIYVFGPGGFSVEPKDKLATSWGAIRSNHQS